jgi:hypothetical protein
MGVLGELFPGPKIRDESTDAGNGEQWQLGPIDLDNRTVQVQRVAPAEPSAAPAAAPSAVPSDEGDGSEARDG